MLERYFQSKLIDSLKRRGAMVLNLHGHEMMASGWPDLYVSHPIWRGWLELKTERGRLSTLQEMRLKDLAARRDYGYVVRYVDGVTSIDEDVELCGQSVWTWKGGNPLQMDAWELLKRLSQLNEVRKGK